MKSLKTVVLFCLLAALSLFGGCFSQGGIKDVGNTEKTSQVSRGVINGLNTNYTNVYFRGTANNWGTTPMNLVDNNVRELMVYFPGGYGSNDRFKVDVSGNWTEAYPAQDYMIGQGAGEYRITFNEITKVVTATKVYTSMSLTTYSAVINKGDTAFVLPEGAIVNQSGHSNGVGITWTPALDVNKVGTTIYTSTYSDAKVYFTLTVNDVSSGYKTNYANGVFFRGTANNWGTAKMDLVGDYQRELTVRFSGASNDRFKVDVSGNWTVAYPATDYLITNGSGYYKITFNETTKVVTAVRLQVYTTLTVAQSNATINAGDTTFALPAKGNVSQTGGMTFYGEVPLTWTPALDVNKVGTTIYTATYADAQTTFSLTVNGNTSKGKVNVTVYQDSVSSGKLVSVPVSSVGVYLGDWHYGNLLGNADYNGKVTIELDAGTQELGIYVMPNSKTVIQQCGFKVNVVAGNTVNYDIHVAPTPVQIYANVTVEGGKALYLTGETSYLGNWGKAIKLTKDTTTGKWSYYGNLPIGAQYKVVKANDGATEISTAGVTWEQGSNHTIQSLTFGNYSSVNNITPIF